jgi:hypothetical protein
MIRIECRVARVVGDDFPQLGGRSIGSSRVVEADIHCCPFRSVVGPSGNQLQSVPNGRSLSALGGSRAERAELSQRGGAVDPYVFPADQALAELENMQNTDADPAAVARYAQEVTNYLGGPDFVVNDKVFAVKPMEHIRPLALHVGKQIAVPFCFQTSMSATPSKGQRCTRWPASISPTSSLPDRPTATHTIPHRWPASSVAAGECPARRDLMCSWQSLIKF